MASLAPYFESIPTTKANLELRHQWFSVAEDHLYAEVEHSVSVPEGGVRVVPGKVGSWRGVALTHVPDRPETYWGSSRYRRQFDGEWRWKEEISAPYVRKLVQSLPFTRLDIVRVMTLTKGSFGPAHVDAADDRQWDEEGIASITLLASDGGVPMRLIASDGLQHDVDDPAYFFKDSAPHGVPPARSRRLLLRVNGKADSSSLRKLLRIGAALW